MELDLPTPVSHPPSLEWPPWCGIPTTPRRLPPSMSCRRLLTEVRGVPLSLSRSLSPIGPLRANVVQANVASRKCHLTEISFRSQNTCSPLYTCLYTKFLPIYLLSSYIAAMGKFTENPLKGIYPFLELVCTNQLTLNKITDNRLG
jgi:hypothetical protein